MDLVKLDPTTWLPTDLIERYDQLVWTERYVENGEFVLTSPDINYMRTMLPEGSLLSLRDSDEVMIVETHLITESESGQDVVKVTGRTFETFGEKRLYVGVGISGQAYKSRIQHSTASAISVLLWNSFVNRQSGGGYFEAFAATGLLGNPRGAGLFPNIYVTDSSTAVEPAIDWYINQGNVYPIMMDFIQRGTTIGYRNVRPKGYTKLVVTVNPSTYARILTQLDNIDKLCMDIYNGVDRTDSVAFDVLNGEFKNASYLFTQKERCDFLWVGAPTDTNKWWGVGIPVLYVPPPDFSGFAYKEVYIPGPTQGQLTDADWENLARQVGLIEFNKRNRPLIFDGEVDARAHTFGVDYGLGDLITLKGKYGVSNVVRVTEYVRTEDAQGDRGYPTLQTIVT